VRRRYIRTETHWGVRTGLKKGKQSIAGEEPKRVQRKRKVTGRNMNLDDRKIGPSATRAEGIWSGGRGTILRVKFRTNKGDPDRGGILGLMLGRSLKKIIKI